MIFGWFVLLVQLVSLFYFKHITLTYEEQEQ